MQVTWVRHQAKWYLYASYLTDLYTNQSEDQTIKFHAKLFIKSNNPFTTDTMVLSDEKICRRSFCLRQTQIRLSSRRRYVDAKISVLLSMQRK